MPRSRSCFGMLALFFVFLTCLSPVALASSIVGNGGDVIVCNDEYELLDFYEARVMRDIEFDLGAPDLSVAAKVELALVRLDRLDAPRARLYREWATSFLAETKFLTNIDLPDIPDSGYIYRPSHCTIKQLAIQREPETPLDKRYVIDKRIWDRLTADHRAGLILHEVIFRDAIRRGHLDSITARFFASLVSSTRIETLSEGEFSDLMFTRFMREYRSPSTNTVPDAYFRFFDTAQLTRIEAVAFCDQLPGQSRLYNPGSDAFYFFRSDSAVKRAVLGDDGRRNTRAWVVADRQAFDFRLNLQIILPESEKLPALCVTER